jgi:hypothetical protein
MIVQAVHNSTRAFYSYFRNKDDLVPLVNSSLKSRASRFMAK